MAQAQLPDFYLVKNWKKYQHYKDRNPPWVKLHVEILSSMDWVTLADASRVFMVVCMVIAAKNEGRVPNNTEYLQRIAYLKEPPDFKPLLKCGFIINPLAAASTPQADARPEAEAEAEAEAERSLRSLPAREPDGWSVWWSEQRNKVGKPKALTSYRKALTKTTASILLAAYRDYVSTKPKDRQWLNPATWLNQERWNDQPAEVPHGKATAADVSGAFASGLADALGLDGMAPERPAPAGAGIRVIDGDFKVRTGPHTGDKGGISRDYDPAGRPGRGIRDSGAGPSADYENLPRHAEPDARGAAEHRHNPDKTNLEVWEQDAASGRNPGHGEPGMGGGSPVLEPGKDRAPEGPGPSAAGQGAGEPPTARPTHGRVSEDDGLEIPAFLKREAGILARVLGTGPAARATIGATGRSEQPATEPETV